MRKRDELTDPNSCMSKALPDERTFVLLARDEIAPKVVREWARLRCLHGKNSVKDPQIVEALECADLMDQERADVKNAVRLAGPSRPVEAQPPAYFSNPALNWTEDAGHENGNYQNRCVICHQVFIGHKRRVVCKVCAVQAPPADTPATPLDDPWPVLNRMRGRLIDANIAGTLTANESLMLDELNAYADRHLEAFAACNSPVAGHVTPLEEVEAAAQPLDTREREWRMTFTTQTGHRAVHRCVHEAEARACANSRVTSPIVEFSDNHGLTWQNADTPEKEQG